MKKGERFDQIVKWLTVSRKFFIVGIDNVSSKQINEIRLSLKEIGAKVLIGKNTMIRKILKEQVIPNDPLMGQLLPYIRGNVGFLFVENDMNEVKDLVRSRRCAAPAKAGAIAPADVKLTPMATALGPEKTSFFQALNIATKITRGKIEILNPIHLIKQDAKIGPSEATLLNMLGIIPFFYELKLIACFDNGIFPVSVLDISEEDILAHVVKGIGNLVGFCNEISYPTKANVLYNIRKCILDCYALEQIE